MICSPNVLVTSSSEISVRSLFECRLMSGASIVTSPNDKKENVRSHLNRFWPLSVCRTSGAPLEVTLTSVAHSADPIRQHLVRPLEFSNGWLRSKIEYHASASQDSAGSRGYVISLLVWIFGCPNWDRKPLCRSLFRRLLPTQTGRKRWILSSALAHALAHST